MVDYIREWKEEAQRAFSEYKQRDCGRNVYTKDTRCRRLELVIIDCYLDFLCLTKGPKIAGNHRRYMRKGDRERKDEVRIIINEWNLNN